MSAARNRSDLSGKRFGRLMALGYSHTNHNRKAFWFCACECGQFACVMAMRLKSGHTQSCGCRIRDGKGNPIHEGVGSLAYSSWASAKSRCYSETDEHYPSYGGRGVRICDRWLNGENGKHPFECFLEDMGPRPAGTTLDRYPNNDGIYEPGNCRWATPIEQANNRRSNRRVFALGSSLTIAQAIRKFGLVSRDVISDRLRKGWPADAACAAPLGSRPGRDFSEVRR